MLFDYDFKNYNYRIFLYMLALNTVGVLVIISATNRNAPQVSKQIIGILVSFLFAIAFSLWDYHKILKLSTIIYAISCISLLAVLLFGKNVNGATRWIVLPVIGQIQPSEFVKIGLIIFFSWYFSKYQEKIDNVFVLAGALVLFFIPFILIFEEPDFSTSLVVLFIMVSMVFASGVSYRWILSVLAVFTPLFTLFIYLLQKGMVLFLEPYQVNRILAWFYPAQYSDSRYQQENSIMAIASGQLKGKDLFNNTLMSVKNGNFLSEEETDFIFAVVGEELGFIGCTLVIILFALIVFEFLWMASKAKDLSGKLICIGMASFLAFQGFANIAVATGIFPNTGLPLPFISYGTSSLISIYIGIGIVQNVGLQRKSSNH